jgi:hypothetical protein
MRTSVTIALALAAAAIPLAAAGGASARQLPSPCPSPAPGCEFTFVPPGTWGEAARLLGRPITFPRTTPGLRLTKVTVAIPDAPPPEEEENACPPATAVTGTYRGAGRSMVLVIPEEGPECRGLPGTPRAVRVGRLPGQYLPARGSRPAMLMWSRNDTLYDMSARGLSLAQMLTIARSVR